VHIPKGLKVRRLHKAFLRWHDANNWPILREALRRMGRADLIGPGKHHLIPAWQPLGTGDAHEGRRMPNGSRRSGGETATPKHSKHPHAASGANAKRSGAPHAAASGKSQSNKPMKFRTQHTGLKGVRLPRSK
jgi:hypothetical protein